MRPPRTSTSIGVRARVPKGILVINARGPWVEAIKRHDPGLRVRWSPEKKKWCVDAPARTLDPRWMDPPVRYVSTDGGKTIREVVLPLDSERHILWRDKRYAVLYSKTLDKRLYDAVVSSDAARVRGVFRHRLRERIHGDIIAKHARSKKRSAERAYSAHDYWRSLLRKNDDGGAGISTKGWRPKKENEVQIYA